MMVNNAAAIGLQPSNIDYYLKLHCLMFGLIVVRNNFKWNFILLSKDINAFVYLGELNQHNWILVSWQNNASC